MENSNNLIHLDTTDIFYDWTNGQEGNSHTSIRSERTICNQHELKHRTLIIVVLLLKTTVTTTIFSPFILRKIDFVNLFKFHKIWTLSDHCRKTIYDHWNTKTIGFVMYTLHPNI